MKIKSETKQFLEELADLLSKHGAELEAEEVQYPYEERPRAEISVCVAGQTICLDSGYVSSYDIERVLER